MYECYVSYRRESSNIYTIKLLKRGHFSVRQIVVLPRDGPWMKVGFKISPLIDNFSGQRFSLAISHPADQIWAESNWLDSIIWCKVEICRPKISTALGNCLCCLCGNTVLSKSQRIITCICLADMLALFPPLLMGS